MSEVIFIVESSEREKALRHSIFTEGEILDELKGNIKTMVKFCFEQNEISHIIRLHTIKDEVIAM
jgi:hypothetical protein